jgi:hypothetical protein
VEEWWRLTAKYSRFRTPSNLTLKEYGYMKLFELIEKHRPRRILEFGHAFSSTLFEYCEEHGIEVWGIDDHMNLPYFPPRDEWRHLYKVMLVDRLQKTKFLLGQLGTRRETREALPKGYFDMVCSVSVLEEIGDPEIIVSILQHSHELLKPGALLANSHDLVFGDCVRTKLFLDCMKRAGFDCALTAEEEKLVTAPWDYVPWQKVLLENPTQAMVCYNLGEADRIFSGHWTTLISVAQK